MSESSDDEKHPFGNVFIDPLAKETVSDAIVLEETRVVGSRAIQPGEQLVEAMPFLVVDGWLWDMGKRIEKLSTEDRVELHRKLGSLAPRDLAFQDQRRKWVCNRKGLFFLPGQEPKPVDEKDWPLIESQSKTEMAYRTDPNLRDWVRLKIETNSFGDWTYHIPSRFNHSCFPNAKVIINEAIHQLKITTTRSIANGEEITINYWPISPGVEHILSEAPARQKWLAKRNRREWTCLCERCLGVVKPTVEQLNQAFGFADSCAEPIVKYGRGHRLAKRQKLE